MHFDILVRGGLLIDGSGAAPRVADVGIVRDRVVEIGFGEHIPPRDPSRLVPRGRCHADA